ncbi:HNH endonuclease family protein [Sinosporangium siamense]|uniref:GmrSD restriction endonucleases C-terminal domain-containing protein n=1 Tax=Sinosporangium siamense TaxID=1367973 RepID=A0A919RRF5_9ACTN|nr:HNH endonuclease family protein [Sinosporangium siamense]GII96879.1 hypothetical protein Ssi02_71100 [Sinosporangium siamense]
MHRVVHRALAVPAATAAALTLMGGTAYAYPPGIPSANVAAAELAELTVEPESHASTYDRDLFPHWSTISGTCNTRETVLKRDGRNVVTNTSCAAVSGSWLSPYDGETWTRASDIDIDHMVPLSEAWKSGAWAWTTQRRRTFANDLANSQLWAVTDNVNQAKGDKDPGVWKPPLNSFWCEYARSWIDVKYEWGLSIDRAEKAALAGMLDTC